jgi:hypothetical protein
MRAFATPFLLLLLAPPLLHGQSRDQTFAFLAGELHALASKDYYLREVSLSPDGQRFTFRNGFRGKPERSLVIPLEQVDIFYVTDHHPTGCDQYDLEVRSRGRDGAFFLNGSPFRGQKTLVKGLQSERKAKALDQAFNRLIELATGRKPLFPKGD